jgi:AraC-like DNA-binding protein
MSEINYPNVYLYRRVVKAKLFIDTSFAESIDVNNIADEAFFSKFHFIRLFKKIYGKTPHEYLRVVRIEKAMELLRNGNSVSDVCYAVGFQSLSSFSGLFKKLVGSSPSAYLLTQQKIRAHIQNAPLDFIPGCFAEKKGWKKKAILKK